MAVAISVALTVALGTLPPDGSTTVPLMLPRKVWAFTATASENAIRITMTRRFIDSTPPLFEINELGRSLAPLAKFVAGKQHSRAPHLRSTLIEKSSPLYVSTGTR